MAKKVYANDPQASRYQKPRKATVLEKSIAKNRKDSGHYTMREANPDRDDKALRELVLQQIVNAPTNYQGYEDMQVQSNLIPKVAQGGIMDLRQQGGLTLGPGTETSDDIPAMLSDGEFVMTGKAVRGFGNGSRQAGAKKLYSMMHQAEKNATG